MAANNCALWQVVALELYPKIAWVCRIAPIAGRSPLVPRTSAD
jgi:hypothetical protein